MGPSQELTSEPSSLRAPCDWRMETRKKLQPPPLPVVGDGSAGNLHQRKAKGVADLWKVGAGLCEPQSLGKKVLPSPLGRAMPPVLRSHLTGPASSPTGPASSPTSPAFSPPAPTLLIGPNSPMGPASSPAVPTSPIGPASRPAGPASPTGPASRPMSPSSGLHASLNFFPIISADSSCERSVYK